MQDTPTSAYSWITSETFPPVPIPQKWKFLIGVWDRSAGLSQFERLPSYQMQWESVLPSTPQKLACYIQN